MVIFRILPISIPIMQDYASVKEKGGSQYTGMEQSLRIVLKKARHGAIFTVYKLL